MQLSEIRAAAIIAAAGSDPGPMASVRADPAQLTALRSGTGAVMANHNAPDQMVISGA